MTQRPGPIARFSAVSNPAGTAEDMTAAISAGFFSAKEATCGGGCNVCTGVVGLTVSPDPASTAISSTVQMTATATYNNGTHVDKTNSSAWASDTTTVATVTTNGTSGRGVVT